MDRKNILLLGLVLAATLLLSPSLQAQHHDPGARHAGSLHDGQDSYIWEGSPEGKTYSEFNHHLAGAFVLLMGLSELGGSLALTSLAWSRFLLPLAMLGAGLYLLGWSDHEAWPIGSQSFSQTFLGGDLEILQHKAYAVFLFGVGGMEMLRRSGKIRKLAWGIPLPLFAILGGVLLFLHQHGDHPAAHKIAMNHMVMGTIAIAAGTCKLAGWSRLIGDSSAARPRHSGWDLAWAALILMIGLQLLIYTE